MSHTLAAIALRMVGCVAVSYALWRYMGAIGLAASAPLFGVALAKPLLDLGSELRHSVRRRVYARVEGQHFEHRGFHLDIREDEGHHRWISLHDVKKLIPALPRPAVLRSQFPQAIQHDPELRGDRIRVDALLAYLSKSTDADSLRFRNWLERDVDFPAAAVRRRLGIKDPETPKDAPESDQAA